MEDEGLAFRSLDCTEVEGAAAKLECLLRETENIEAKLSAYREENATLEGDVLEKVEESTKLRRLCEAALARKHERLQALRQITQLRQSRRELAETRELASHGTQQEVIALQAQYNSLVEKRNAKQALLTAAREKHEEELERLREVLRSCKRETEEKFGRTARAQEAAVAARQEGDRLSRELQSAALHSSNKNKESDLCRSRERQQTYDSLLERIRQAEQRKQSLLLPSHADSARIIQIHSSKRARAPLSAAPRSGRILSELIEDAGQTKNPFRAQHQHLDI